ncbi:hypothetical protein ACIQB4_29535 [Streptomyces griseoluteus]
MNLPAPGAVRTLVGAESARGRDLDVGRVGEIDGWHLLESATAESAA